MQTKIEKNSSATAGDNLNPFKSAMTVKSASMADQHINGVSMTLLIVFLVGAVKTAIILDTQGFKDLTIFTVVIPFMAVGFILFFAIQIARQWEKAVVLRMGKIPRLERSRSVLDHSDPGHHHHLDRPACDGHALLRREDAHPDTVPVEC